LAVKGEIPQECERDCFLRVAREEQLVKAAEWMIAFTD
jgi:hypothetical protein